MGLRWYRHVWENERLGKKPASYKLVMLALADHADNETGKCNPGIARLSTMTGISERQVQRLLNDLELEEFIQVERSAGRHHSNEYTIKGDTHVTFSSTKGDTHVTISEEKVTPMSPFPKIKGDTHVTISKEKVTPTSPFMEEKVTPSAEKVTPMSPDPIDPSELNKDDHMPGIFLRTILDDAGFIYRDRNFSQIAAKLESDYSHEQLIRALESAKDAHKKKTSKGERGITAPLAYMRSILVANGNKEPPPKTVSGNVAINLSSI